MVCKMECRHIKFLQYGLQVMKDVHDIKHQANMFVSLLHSSFCCNYILSQQKLLKIMRNKCIQFKSHLDIDVEMYVEEIDKLLKNEIVLHKIQK